MIHSEKGKVIIECSKNDVLAEGEIYADLACIFDAITHKYNLYTLINYIEIYTKELKDGNRH